jgi:hypothetical protein
LLCKDIYFWTSFIHSWISRTQLALIDIQFDQRKHKEFLRESDRVGKNLKTFLLLWQKLKWQKISICKCEHFFDIWSGIFFCHLMDWASSIQTVLQTCSLWTGRSLCYKSVSSFPHCKYIQRNYSGNWTQFKSVHFAIYSPM